MTAEEFYTTVLAPAADLPPVKVLRSEASDVLLLAFSGHETNWTDFVQEGGGPGRGPWQFGYLTVCDVLNDPATHGLALAVCAHFEIKVNALLIYDALPTNLALAYAFARLLLLADPYPLSAVGDAAGALAIYLRVWRPGRPHEETWDYFYTTAVATVRAAQPMV